MNITSLNNSDKETTRQLLFSCCGSQKWTNIMFDQMPFENISILVKSATDAWYNVCGVEDWQEAFTHHPKIGDKTSLSEKFANTQHLAGEEQSGVNTASENIIQQLAVTNAAYEKKFGFIFIVCATGKSATEMLQLLQDRMNNNPEEEIRIAMAEQHKITLLRLKKILDSADWSAVPASQLTTHVLDTSLGKPGQQITTRLKEQHGEGWRSVAQGCTNADGRVSDLLPPGRTLAKGNYKMVFETGAYFFKNKLQGFYPEVEIQFTVVDDAHYHVPLLINPFGYSTYRGS